MGAPTTGAHRQAGQTQHDPRLENQAAPRGYPRKRRCLHRGCCVDDHGLPHANNAALEITPAKAPDEWLLQRAVGDERQTGKAFWAVRS